jgi:hypothetical protein
MDRAGAEGYGMYILVLDLPVAVGSSSSSCSSSCEMS